MISLLCEVQKQKQNKLMERERPNSQKRGLPEAGEWAKWMKVFKRYKLSVIRELSHGDLMYSMVTIVKNI